MSDIENRTGDLNPELSVILVNLNDGAHVAGCLSSLAAAARRTRHEIIVVDNASTDGSPDLVGARFPLVKLVRNAVNLGYSRANNLGYRESRGEFILFLNTDTVVPPGTLEALLAEMKQDPGIGAAGPALLRDDNSYQVSFGRRVDFFSELFQKCFFNLYYKNALKFRRKTREVGWLSGAFLLTRRQVLAEVGLFDENFFLYFEDIDLCRRIKKRGYRLAYLPVVSAFHKGGAATSRLKLMSRLEYRKSQLYFYRKHSSRLSFILLGLYLRLGFGLARLSGKMTEEENKLFKSAILSLTKKSTDKEPEEV